MPLRVSLISLFSTMSSWIWMLTQIILVFNCKSLLTLYTQTLVSIFSIPFSIHFLRCWQGEFVLQSWVSSVGDYFFILLTLMFDSGVMLWGEIRCLSLLGVKGLMEHSATVYKHIEKAPLCSFPQEWSRHYKLHVHFLLVWKKTYIRLRKDIPFLFLHNLWWAFYTFLPHFFQKESEKSTHCKIRKNKCAENFHNHVENYT